MTGEQRTQATVQNGATSEEAGQDAENAAKAGRNAKIKFNGAVWVVRVVETIKKDIKMALGALERKRQRMRKRQQRARSKWTAVRAFAKAPEPEREQGGIGSQAGAGAGAGAGQREGDQAGGAAEVGTEQLPGPRPPIPEA